MEMTPIYAFTILLVIFALGEIIAQKTKAVMSTTLVIAATLLILFWTVFSDTVFPGGKLIFPSAKIVPIGMVLIGPLIVGIGTIMDFKELARQWVTVIVSLGAMVVGVVLIIVIAPIFIDKTFAVGGAPIFAGGNVATLIMQGIFNEKGMTEVATFCVLVLVSQNFIGIPVASQFLRREAKHFINDPENIKKYSNSETATAGAKRKLLAVPFNKPSAVFAKLALVACLSFFIASLTKGKIHYFVVTLIMGIVFSELGFLEKDALGKTGAATFLLFATTVILFANLAATTPAMVASMLFPLLVVLVLGVLGVVIAGIVFGKVFRISPYLSIAMGLTCTFGFPTTMFMSEEVAEAVGRNDEEKTAIRNYILPKMITAGIVTVTIASVVVAGIVAGMINSGKLL